MKNICTDFHDALVMRLFDSDGDGRLSPAEEATLRLFRDWTFGTYGNYVKLTKEQKDICNRLWCDNLLIENSRLLKEALDTAAPIDGEWRMLAV